MSFGDAGPWYRPSQAAPLLGICPRAVRELCQDGQIDRRENTGPSGAVRYLISMQAIERYIARTTIRAKARRPSVAGAA